MINETSLDTVCAALTYAMGVEAPKEAAAPNPIMKEYLDKVFGGQKADRVLMFNPDAVAQWIYEKYEPYVKEVTDRTEIAVPMQSVMPSVTPVCFGTMYTGAQPAVHGIQKYEKPVIKIDTIFDALLRAGKKPAIIAASPKCSMANIFLERNMDYYITGTIGETWGVAAELIMKDEHDLIILYNGNYDAKMHKFAPEGTEALAELRTNTHTFVMLHELIKKHWKHHNTFLGYAMDHGCHEIDGGCGSHGLDMEEDLNICHRYVGIPREETV